MKDLKSILTEKEYLSDLQKISIEKKVPIIDYEVGRFLEAIIFIKNPKNIIEIGCGEGYSSYFLIKNLKEDAEYTGIDLNCKRLEKAKKFILECFPNIKTNFYCGNALNLIPTLNSKFDFAFIDAAKFEYPNYLETLVEKLQQEAVIIADNIFYDEKIFSRFVKEHDKNSLNGIKKFIKVVSNKNNFETRFIDIGDGLSISIFKGKNN